METFATICLVVALIASLGVGGRLVALWSRSRALPELLLGIAFLGTGVGHGFAELGTRVLWPEHDSWTTALSAGLFAFAVIGTCALFGMIRVVFRPDRVGDVLTVAFCAITWLAYAGRLYLGDFATGSVDSWASHLYVSMRMTAFVWAAVEAFSYYGLLRKRVALGLGSPLGCLQIQLWGIAAACSAGMTFVVGACYVNYRIDPLSSPLATASLTIFVIGTVVSTWCSFFPPPALRDYAVRRHPAPAA